MKKKHTNDFIPNHKNIPPLKMWKRDFCDKCDQNCLIGHERFMMCILCGIFYSVNHGKNPLQTIKHKKAHPK